MVGVSRTLFRLPLVAAVALMAALPGPAPWAQHAATPIRVSATGLDGRPVSLADAAGRPALVMLWTPESLASRKSIGEFQRFFASPEANDWFVLAVSLADDAKALANFMAARKLDFPVAQRGQHNLGRINDDQLPVLLVFNAEGRLERSSIGLFNLTTLRALLGR